MLNKINIPADETIIYKAKKGSYQLLQSFIIAILMFCLYILIYKYIPGASRPVIYSHIVFGLVFIIVIVKAYFLYKKEITDLIFTDKRIIAVSPVFKDDIEYKDIYDIVINRNKHKLSIYLFNGKVYVYSNYNYNKKILKLISQYCPHLIRDNEKDKY